MSAPTTSRADAASAPRRPWRRWLVGEPVSAWRVVPLAALFLVAPEALEARLFAPAHGIDWPLTALDVCFYVVLGVIIWLCCTRLDDALDARRMPVGWRLAVGAVAIELGTALAYEMLTVGPFGRIEMRYLQGPEFWRWWLHVALLALLVYGWIVLYRSSRVAEDRERGLRLETERLAATIAGAELALLEAQIEPHFLFNTLAHIKRDLRIAPDAAREMLGALIQYLDRASPALQRSDWTIADELELVAVYLRIVGQRFGSRLRFSIEGADSFGEVRLPALAIATLVENAVRHGLAPKPEGGSVRISVGAQALSDAPSGVRITVEDDGVGLRQTSGHGLGLATVRARLRSAFGANAVLTIEPRGDDGATGVSAAIRIPRHA